MKSKILQVLFIALILVSCGPKPSDSITVVSKETNAYTVEVDGNSHLKEETIEGALTDADGFKDIGKFKYSVYYDAATNLLYKIKNVEITDATISETYYFNNNDLVMIETELGGKSTKMYVQKNKIISEHKTDVATQKLLLEKAKRFHKNFKKEH